MSVQQKAADKQFKKANQAITKSIFNWTKDYASGASLFEQALKMYKQIPNWDKCLQTLEKLIECNSALNKGADTWAVARNYEEILDIKIKHYPKTTTEELIKIANEAFISFRMSESTDKGLGLVAKVAKYLISRGNMKEGVEYLEQAYQTIISEEKVFKKDQIFNQLVDIYMDNGAFQGAEKMYLDEILRRQGKDCDQMGLIVLILILIQREPKRAQKKMYEIADMVQTFLTSNQCEAGDELIKSYVKGQEEKFRKQTTRSIVSSIYPVSIVRKLREISVPKMGEKGEEDKEEGANSQLKELLF